MISRRDLYNRLLLLFTENLVMVFSNLTDCLSTHSLSLSQKRLSIVHKYSLLFIVWTEHFVRMIAYTKVTEKTWKLWCSGSPASKKKNLIFNFTLL